MVVSSRLFLCDKLTGDWRGREVMVVTQVWRTDCDEATVGCDKTTGTQSLTTYMTYGRLRHSHEWPWDSESDSPKWLPTLYYRTGPLVEVSVIKGRSRLWEWEPARRLLQAKFFDTNLLFRLPEIEVSERENCASVCQCVSETSRERLAHSESY